MSDYMFVLESHLTAEQSRALAAVRDAAENAGLNLFLTGGAMRDMMGGFPIRDLDFTIEGAALKLARSLGESGATIISTDEQRKSAELLFPGNVSVSLAIARQERYAKPASKPQVQPATIHEDLRCRDFTVNAIALSLGKASRGLLLDPMNGLGDLNAKELRATSNHTLWDDPSRLFRLVRLRTRLGFAVDERTSAQARAVREAKLDSKITPAALQHEIRQIALEPSPGEVLKALEDEGLLELISPALAGPKLNLPGFQKLQKVRQSLPFGTPLPVNSQALFFALLFEKLSPKERSSLIQTAGLGKEEVEAATKLEARANKVEKELAAARITRPSVLYELLTEVSGEILLFILLRSGHRIVLDRVKNYLQKYLPMAQEVTDASILDLGLAPGTPKFIKTRRQMIAAKLNARPKKVIVEEPPPPPPPGPGRRSASFARS